MQRLLSAVVARKALPYTDEIVAAGQTLVSHVFATARLEQWMIDEAEIEVTQQGYYFNRAGWEYILRTYGGRIPLTMFGVEEGRVVKPQTPILEVVNEDVKLAWLVPYFEPVIQSTIWSMSTTATNMRYLYKEIAKYMEKTGSDMSMLEYKVHYFGDRGANSPDETPVMKSMAHAMLFSGSDSARVNRYIKALYNTAKAYTSSVEATEHTTMCLNSDAERKDDFGAMEMVMRRLHAVVARAKAGIGIPVLSAVIDTYDDERFVTEYIAYFKDEIANSGGRLVSRPDSGKPQKKLPEVLDWLEGVFGATPNNLGYKNLPAYSGALYGDGLGVESALEMVKATTEAGWSLDNYLMGMGGGIANDGGRDDLSFSMKTIASFADNRWTRLLKEPKSDLGKKSLSGLVRCREEDGQLVVYDALRENGQYEYFNPGAGHRRWLDNGFRDWRQDFDNVRDWARKDYEPVVKDVVAA